MMSKKTKNSELITKIYSAALAPETYDSLMQSVEDFLVEGIPTGRDSERKIDPELINHFKTAYALHIKMGRRKNALPWAEAMVRQVPGLAMIMDMSERILATNQAAHERMGFIPRTLNDLPATSEQLQEVRNWMHDSSTSTVFVRSAYELDSQCNNAIVLRKILAGQGGEEMQNESGADGRNCIFITGVELMVERYALQHLQNTYGLTPAEGEIATDLMQGLTPAELADHRNVSTNTIRSQIKALQRKMHAKGIADIVRLVCGFAAGIAASYQASDKIPAASDPDRHLRREASMTLQDGRHLEYLEQGAPNGTPVLFLHSMLYGVRFTASAISAANHKHLRFISPSRPGYGKSDFAQNAFGDELLNTVAHDVCELLDHLGIQKAIIMGSAIGSVYALRFAHLFPNRVQALIAVGHAPIWRDSWMGKLPTRQRLIAQLSKNFPAMLPLVTRTGIALMDAGYKNKFIDALHQNIPADVLALQQSAILDVVHEGLDHTVAQGGEAFRRDCFFAVTDYVDEARRLQKPFHFIHGSMDKVVPLSNVETFAHEVPSTTFEVIDGAGQFLMMSHWQYVFKALKARA